MASRDSTHGRFTIWHIPNDNEAVHFSSTKAQDPAHAKAKIEASIIKFAYLRDVDLYHYSIQIITPCIPRLNPTHNLRITGRNLWHHTSIRFSERIATTRKTRPQNRLAPKDEDTKASRCEAKCLYEGGTKTKQRPLGVQVQLDIRR